MIEGGYCDFILQHTTKKERVRQAGQVPFSRTISHADEAPRVKMVYILLLHFYYDLITHFCKEAGLFCTRYDLIYPFSLMKAEKRTHPFN